MCEHLMQCCCLQRSCTLKAWYGSCFSCRQMTQTCQSPRGVLARGDQTPTFRLLSRRELCCQRRLLSCGLECARIGFLQLLLQLCKLRLQPDLQLLLLVYRLPQPLAELLQPMVLLLPRLLLEFCVLLLPALQLCLELPPLLFVLSQLVFLLLDLPLQVMHSVLQCLPLLVLLLCCCMLPCPQLGNLRGCRTQLVSFRI